MRGRLPGKTTFHTRELADSNLESAKRSRSRKSAPGAAPRPVSATSPSHLRYLLLLAGALIPLALWAWREPIELGLLRRGGSEALERFVVRHPDSVAGLALFTERCLEEGRPQLAITRLVDRVEEKPAHPRLRVLAARALMAAGDDKAAYAHLRVAVNLDPENAEAQRELAEALVRAERNDEADQILRALLQRNPNDAETLVRLGRLADREGLFSEAERHFRRAQELAPRNGDALAGLAEVLVRLGKPEEAVPFARRAAREQPNRAYPHLWLARALQAVNPDANPAEIEAAYQRAMELSKEPALPRMFYAQFLRERGRLPEAIRLLETNTQANPLDKLSWYELSLAYRLQGEAASATEATARFRKLNAMDLQSSELEYRVWADPENLPHRLKLARFYLRHGRPDLARPQVEHVLNRNPDLAAAKELAAAIDRHPLPAPAP